ncbi:chromate efflux transporter [Pedobacter nutrimenti]|uniref:chromate efflux transporter n=1 Tax=Pedobacter nutrimenti TaxID=1241337 RepID=UPI002930C448|nr:chromate efflux transporter [Pedobacter nutrimenti]
MMSSFERKPPVFKDALKFWFKLGWISFGGTVGHINIMHDEMVTKRKWISSSRFFHALSLCMLLPGPEAQQLAIYIGWQLHGLKGGLIAGILFVLPSMVILLLLSMFYVYFGNQPWMFAMFNGFKPAVIAIIIVALLGIGKKALHTSLHVLVALLAFAGIFFFNLSMLMIITGAIVWGIVVWKFLPGLLDKKNGVNKETTVDERAYYFNKNSIALGSDATIKKSIKRTVVFILLWLIPITAFYFFAVDFSFWKQLSLFFTETALFTIGGSYTVLPYVAQFSVTKLNWLNKMQMIDGFALAETTPGPLIIVVSYVGFMAAYNHFSGSMLMGAGALLLTTFLTFLPSFLFIFVGGPIIERTHGNKAMGSILSFVTAAVVGVILNLTLFLGKDVVFPNGVSTHSIDLYALGWIVFSLILMKRFKLNVLYIIGLSLIFGLIHY